MKRIRFIFWLHWIVCGAAHLLAPLCFVATIRWFFGYSHLDFWDMCLVMGAGYCGAVYVANHVANPQGFCSLTELEKHYRKKQNLPACGDSFLPRFYTKCRQISKADFRRIPL